MHGPWGLEVAQHQLVKIMISLRDLTIWLTFVPMIRQLSLYQFLHHNVHWVQSLPV